MISSSVTLVWEGAGLRGASDADCRNCAAVRRDCHIRGTRHLAVMHILREADCARPPGRPAGVRAMASATPSPTATPAAITTPVTATVSASVTVTAAAKILAGAVATAAGGIVLRGIVMRREVLGREALDRLAFLSHFGVAVFRGSGLERVVMFTRCRLPWGRFIVRSVLLIG